MKAIELFERASSKCIVVDIQPSYIDKNIRWVPELMEWLNKQGPILKFVNTEDQGLTDDTIQDIKEFWIDNGFNPERYNQTEIVDKGYGYLRGWMDYQKDFSEEFGDKVIIKTIREMYIQKVRSSDMLFGINIDKKRDFFINLDVPEDYIDFYIKDSIHVEWTSISQLKKYNGAFLMGGGREECLREITLIMNAFNIKYKLVKDFIY